VCVCVCISMYSVCTLVTQCGDEDVFNTVQVHGVNYVKLVLCYSLPRYKQRYITQSINRTTFYTSNTTMVHITVKFTD
jgi:hypothetical protein